MRYIMLYEKFSEKFHFLNGKWYDLKIIKHDSFNNKEQYSVKFLLDEDMFLNRKAKKYNFIWLDIEDGQEVYHLGNDNEEFKNRLNLELSNRIDEDPQYIFTLAYIPQYIREKYKDILNAKTWGLIGENNYDYIKKDIESIIIKLDAVLGGTFSWDKQNKISRELIDFLNMNFDKRSSYAVKFNSDENIIKLEIYFYRMIKFVFYFDDESYELKSIKIVCFGTKDIDSYYYEFDSKYEPELMRILKKHLEKDTEAIKKIGYNFIERIFPDFDKNLIDTFKWGLI